MMRSMCSGKVPGVDGISAEIKKGLAVQIKMLYDECLRRGVFPSE